MTENTRRKGHSETHEATASTRKHLRTVEGGRERAEFELSWMWTYGCISMFHVHLSIYVHIQMPMSTIALVAYSPILSPTCSHIHL